MARIVDHRGAALDDWHPLSGTPAPEYVPKTWDGPHVGKRLVDGLRILQRVPVARGLRGFGNAWPSYRYDWTDELWQLTADEQQKWQDAQARNLTRAIPSSEEITRMEATIGWPGHYLLSFPQLMRVVQTAARARARFRDLHSVAHRELKLPLRLVRHWNREGLDRIAAGLRRDDVRVF
jgi:hypothetical protein